MHTAESNFSNFVIEYLGKIETEFEKSLAYLPGAQVGGLESWKKTGGRKSRDTLPLTKYMTMFILQSRFPRADERWWDSGEQASDGSGSAW